MKKYVIRTLLLILLAISGVYLIYTLSAAAYAMKKEPQTLYAPESDDSVEDHILRIHAWVNEPDDAGSEVRKPAELNEKEPVYVGRLQCLTPLSELFREYPNEIYDGVLIYTESHDNADFAFDDPVITLEYDGRIECRYSLDVGDGLLYYGKTKNYMPESLSLRSSTVYGNRSVTVVPYVRGLNGIEEIVSRVHSEMAEYNSIEKVSLLEVCPDLPAALDQVIGDRITLHILVNCYDNLDEKKVNASADIKITYFLPQNVNFISIIRSGHGNALSVRDLSTYIKLEVVDYQQIAAEN